MSSKVHNASQFIRNQVKKRPKQAIILGTGLKDIVNQFDILSRIPLSDIPSFPEMTVHHMDATLYLAAHRNVPIWLLGGRLHYYEGYPMDEVTFPIRMLTEAGTQSFFITNAAGNVNPDYSAGDLILIRDHINWSFPSPLIGKNNDKWGPRYPAMSNIYNPDINQKLLNYAIDSGFQLNAGIYLGLTGPQLETPAEYKLFRKLGADMVGMSTIPEAIVAAHMNCRITAMSILSNDASDLPEQGSTDLPEILRNIEHRKEDVAKIIRAWLGFEG